MKIEPCNTCGAGTFFAAGTKCPRCDGSGKVEVKTLLEIMALYGEPLTQKQKMAFDCWLNQNAPLGRRAGGKP